MPLLGTGGVLFVAVLMSACAAQSSGPPTHTIEGHLELKDDGLFGAGIAASGGTCHGVGRYFNVTPGLPITIKDESGTIVGTASLNGGIGTANSCSFPFLAKDVGEAKFYTFESGDYGEVTFSRADIESKGWRVELAIGY